jgi:hypothetical protein
MFVLFSGVAILFGADSGSDAWMPFGFAMGSAAMAGGMLPFLVAIWMSFWHNASTYGGYEGISEWRVAADFYWDLTLFCTVLALFSTIFARLLQWDKPVM